MNCEEHFWVWSAEYNEYICDECGALSSEPEEYIIITIPIMGKVLA